MFEGQKPPAPPSLLKIEEKISIMVNPFVHITQYQNIKLTGYKNNTNKNVIK